MRVTANPSEERMAGLTTAERIAVVQSLHVILSVLLRLDDTVKVLEETIRVLRREPHVPIHDSFPLHEKGSP